MERQDVYFHPEYLSSYEKETQAEACCAVIKDGEAVLLYPFLKSVIKIHENLPNDKRLNDIQSAYGYGGPVVNVAGETIAFLNDAWTMFSDWCAQQHVVSEFVRFHPLLDNVRWAPNAMRTFKDRVTIPIMLEGYSTAIQNSSYYRVHRQMLSKAQRSGFSFQILPVHGALSWFVPLYLETQEQLQAGRETRFGIDYFQRLADGFGDKAWLGVVNHSGAIVAAVLVFESELFLHSHLMGYRRDLPISGMTNLVYHGIALEGSTRGKSVLHMGGGRTNHEDDSLLRFKKSLSPETRDYWLGTRCHNQLRYDELACAWESRNGPRPANYLQFYNLPSATCA